MISIDTYKTASAKISGVAVAVRSPNLNLPLPSIGYNCCIRFSFRTQRLQPLPLLVRYGSGGYEKSCRFGSS